MADPTDLQKRNYDELLTSVHAEEAYEPKARVQLYVRAREALAEEIEAHDPPLTDREANNLRRQLANAIRALDADFKAEKIDIPDSYTPPKAGGGRQQWTDEELLATKEAALTFTFTPPTATKMMRQKLRVWLALFRRANRQQSATDPLALMWMLVEPLFQIGVVVALYSLLQRAVVLDMPALPFAVVGVSGWLVFRNTFTRSMRDLGPDASITALPLISPLDVYIARGLTMAFTYGTGTIILLGVIGWFDTIDPPQAIVSTIGLWLSLWAMGLGAGMMTGYAATIYPGVRRLAPLLLRLVFFFSGIMFVSEQLPEEFKPSFLWNPLMHAIQLLRDAFFTEYDSQDASALYVAFFASALILGGLATERIKRRRVGKV